MTEAASVTVQAAGSGSLSLLPLALFMAVQSITPGPNNIMLAAAGAAAGFRATIPHLLGISFGMVVQITVLAAGLAPILNAYPVLLDLLGVVCVGYLGWLALRLLRARPPADGAAVGSARPMTFAAATLFQWINPKAWMMSLTVVSAFWPGQADFVDAALSIALVTSAVNLPCISVWAAAGTGLKRWLTRPARWRAFNAAMAVLLLLTALTLIG